MKKIITIQHPQSEQHINGMIGSWADWDLTNLGVEHAHHIGEKLSREIVGEKFFLYASDLRRTRHTAEIIAAHIGTEPIYSGLLREFHLGAAVGKTKNWARQNTQCPFGRTCVTGRQRRMAGFSTVPNQEKRSGAGCLIFIIRSSRLQKITSSSYRTTEH